MVMVASSTLLKSHSHFRAADNIANIITSMASTSWVGKIFNVKISCNRHVQNCTAVSYRVVGIFKDNNWCFHGFHCYLENNPQNLIIVYNCNYYLVGPRNLIREIYHWAVPSKIFTLENYPLYNCYWKRSKFQWTKCLCTVWSFKQIHRSYSMNFT